MRAFKASLPLHPIFKNPTRTWSLGSLLLLVASFGLATDAAVSAQDFPAIERRLGEIIAEGELTLDQANVMMHALREHSKHHSHEHHERAIAQRERIQQQIRQWGVSEDTFVQVLDSLRRVEMNEDQIGASMEAMMRLTRALRSTDLPYQFSPDSKQHLREHAGLNPRQIQAVSEAAKRLASTNKTTETNNERQEMAFDKMMQSIEAMEDRLERVIDEGDISREQAVEKWQMMKDKEMEPKLQVAVVAGDITKRQAERLWKEIQEIQAELADEEDEDDDDEGEDEDDDDEDDDEDEDDE